MNDFQQRMERVRDIINEDCIWRVPQGSRELPVLGGGGYYTWQFYLRRALLDPFCLQVICEDFWNKFLDRFLERPFQLAGVETAAVPLITALLLDGARRGIEVGAFTIRKEPKSYGRRNLLEGKPGPEPVLFVDDLTSPAHGTFWHAFNTIDVLGMSSYGQGYVVVLKQPGDDPRSIQTSKGPVLFESLFTLADFILSFDDWNHKLRK